MPELPKFQSTKQLPGTTGGVPVSPGVSSQVSEAWEQAGYRVERAGERAAFTFRKLEDAAEAERILNMHYEVEDEFRNEAEGFRERRDYEKFDDDLGKVEDKIRSKYDGRLTTRNTRMAFERSFRTSAGNLRDALLQKKATIIMENALGAFGRTYDKAIEDYGSTDDKNIREAIINNLVLESGVLVNRNIMRPMDRDKLLNNFESQAEEAQVRNMGLTDPLKAYGMLMNQKYFRNIDPIKRAQLTEHMEVRVRMEDVRLEKLDLALQRENQADALNDWAYGKLDFERLMKYRANDPETGKPGLSDAFFSTMLDRIRYGKDVITDPNIFSRLYLKSDLTMADIEANAEKINVNDQRTLLSRILQERREDERDAKALRKQEELVEKAEEREAKRVEREEERRVKEIRNHYAADARAFLKKGFNDYGVGAEEGVKMLRAFQGYVDDSKIPSEELADYAMKVLEARKGGVVRQLWNWMFPDRAKQETIERIEVPVKTGKIEPVIPSTSAPRKSLDEIFGGKKEIFNPEGKVEGSPSPM